MANIFEGIPTRANNTTIDATWFNTIKSTLISSGTVKNNNDATTAPTTSNDDSENYEPGSTWTDVTNDKFYICLDATTSAAVWREVVFIEGTQTLTGAKTFTSPITVTNTTQSTDKDTGAIIVDGGIGVEKNLNVGGTVNIADTTQSTDKDTGAVVVEGGVGVEKNLNVGGNAIITGDLTVQGDTTTVNTATLDVEDPQITLNKNGNQSTADSSDSGIKTEMSDATDCLVHYDSSTTSKWKCGESGSTKEIVTISDTQQITNKDYDGGTASDSLRFTLPKNTTANLSGLTRKEGTLVYDATAGKPYYDDGVVLSEIGGGGASGINYIDNPDAESGITGWSEFDDGGSYVDGTGGTASNLTLTQNTSTPLRGSADFDLVVSAANAQFEGVSTDFTIDKADKYSIINISFDYTTDAPDDFFSVRIYDVTNTTIIYPVPQNLKGNSVETKFAAQFQGTDSTSYRLSIFVDDTDATGYTINFDNVIVGPEEKSDLGKQIYASGAGNGGGVVTVSTTNIDFTEVEDNTNSFDGTTFTLPESGSYYISGSILFTTTGNRTPSLYVGGSFVRAIGSKTGTGSETVGFNTIYNGVKGAAVTIRIEGAGGTLSNVTTFHTIRTEKLGSVGYAEGGRVVSFSANRITDFQALVVNTNDVVEFDNVNHDTHGAWNSGTYTYTIPDSGYYHVHGNLSVIQGATASTYLRGKISSITVFYEDTLTNGKGQLFPFNNTAYYTKGDSIQFTLYSQDQAVSIYTEGSFLNIDKVQGPNAVFGGELVSARYKADSGTLTDGAWTPFDFDTKDFDTHNVVTTGVSWKFTAPTYGLFDCKFYVCPSATAFNAGQILWCRLKKNGTTYSQVACHEFETSITAQLTAHLNDTVEMNKGDYLEFEVYQNSGSNISVAADNSYNYCSITKLS